MRTTGFTLIYVDTVYLCSGNDPSSLSFHASIKTSQIT